MAPKSIRSSSGPQPQSASTGIEPPTSSALVLSTSNSAGAANAILSKFREDLGLLEAKLDVLNTFATGHLESTTLPDPVSAARMMTEYTSLTSAAPDLSTFHDLQQTAYNKLLDLPREARDESAEKEVDNADDPFFERKKTVEAKLSAVWETLIDIVLGRANGEWRTPSQA